MVRTKVTSSPRDLFWLQVVRTSVPSQAEPGMLARIDPDITAAAVN